MVVRWPTVRHTRRSNLGPAPLCLRDSNENFPADLGDFSRGFLYILSSGPFCLSKSLKDECAQRTDSHARPKSTWNIWLRVLCRRVVVAERFPRIFPPTKRGSEAAIGREEAHSAPFCALKSLKRRVWAGGDSHLDISVIPLLGHRLYTCEYRLGARAW